MTLGVKNLFYHSRTTIKFRGVWDWYVRLILHRAICKFCNHFSFLTSSVINNILVLALTFSESTNSENAGKSLVSLRISWSPSHQRTFYILDNKQPLQKKKILPLLFSETGVYALIVFPWINFHLLNQKHILIQMAQKDASNTCRCQNFYFLIQLDIIRFIQ